MWVPTWAIGLAIALAGWLALYVWRQRTLEGMATILERDGKCRHCASQTDHACPSVTSR